MRTALVALAMVGGVSGGLAGSPNARAFESPTALLTSCASSQADEFSGADTVRTELIRPTPSAPFTDLFNGEVRRALRYDEWITLNAEATAEISRWPLPTPTAR